MSGPVTRLNEALSDRYRIERELGEGGMATVYLADDLKHNRKVAIKVLKSELSAVVGAERFLAEIETTAALQHPHILPLFDSGEADGFLYYVMPYVEGESLRERLDRERQLSVDEAVKVGVAVGNALHYAHQRGVIHRDIKPANILIHAGQPVVADFGIALAISAAGGGRLTETGMSVGTPHYMSPEQASAEGDVTGRSDVYSLGAVLFEMLAGEPPHTGPNAHAVIMRILTEEARPLDEIRRSVPPNVVHAVAKALEKLPADRFGNAAAFADALANPTFRRAHGAGSADVPTGARFRQRAFWPLLGALAFAVGLALWGWNGPGAGTVAGDAAWATEIALPGYAPLSSFASVAPDGSFVVYGAGSESGLSLWVRRATSPEPTPLPGGESGYMPAVSPDGRRIAFQQDWRIVVMPVEGGTPSLVAETGLTWDRLTWTDDEHVVFARPSGLARFPVDGGGDPEPLTRVDSAAGETRHVVPSALPPGDGVVFTVVGQDAEDLAARRIAVVGPDGGAHSILMPGVQATWAPPDHLLVLRADGEYVGVPFDPADRKVTGAAVPLGVSVDGFRGFPGYASVSGDGRMVFGSPRPMRSPAVVRLRRDGEVVQADSSWGEGIVRNLVVSEDGSLVAVEIDQPQGSSRTLRSMIVVRDLETGARWQVTAAEEATEPVFRPDGSLLFTMGADIRVATPGTAAEPERLAGTGERPTDLALSPDGRTLFYELGGDILARDLDDPDSASRPVVAGPGRQAEPAPSPDGRWLAYTSDESGRAEVYVRPVDPSRAERWQISRRGGLVARWSRDGRELFYRTYLSQRQYYFTTVDSLVAVPVTSGPGFDPAEGRALFPVESLQPEFAVFPDGDFLMIESEGLVGNQRLMMVEDWKALLGPDRARDR
ncbi:MAG: protein kinase [Gemmatimonadota bacterium]|jgi:serine/threonine-protein kinase